MERKQIDINNPGFSEVCFSMPNDFCWSCANSCPVEQVFQSLLQLPRTPNVAGEEMTV